MEAVLLLHCMYNISVLLLHCMYNRLATTRYARYTTRCYPPPPTTMHACLHACMYISVLLLYLLCSLQLAAIRLHLQLCMHVCMHVCMYVCIYQYYCYTRYARYTTRYPPPPTTMRLRSLHLAMRLHLQRAIRLTTRYVYASVCCMYICCSEHSEL